MSRRIFAISSVLGLLLLVALIASSRQVFALTPTPPQPTSTAIPGADFVGTPLSGSAPLTVQFTALNTSILISCSWTFGDGTGQSFTPPAGSNFATCPSVAHTYTNPGAYAVSLSVTKATGMSNSMIKAQYIQVAGLTPTAVSTNNGVPLPDLTISTINYVGSNSGLYQQSARCCDDH